MPIEGAMRRGHEKIHDGPRELEFSVIKCWRSVLSWESVFLPSEAGPFPPGYRWVVISKYHVPNYNINCWCLPDEEASRLRN